MEEYSSFNNVKFEKQGVFSFLFNRFVLIPILDLLPSMMGRSFVTRSSRTVKGVYDNAKSSKALEYLYNFEGSFEFDNGFLNGVFTYLWQNNFINAKAARNRFKLVEDILYNLALKISEDNPGNVINVLSLASGSARVVLKVASRLKSRGVVVNIKLLDLNKDALSLSKKIAEDFGVQDLVSELCLDKVSNFEKYCSGWQPDIIEMVGFMDYLSQEKAVGLSKRIFSNLPKGGYYVTCNIHDNYEKKFVTNVLNWDMIYRSRDELFEVMLSSGFDKSKISVFYEPYKIHGVIFGKK